MQDWAQPPNVGAADVPTLQLALGLAAAVYFLRDQKRAGLGKAFGLATAGLVAGALLGAGVESWLRVDIVPLGVSARAGGGQGGAGVGGWVESWLQVDIVLLGGSARAGLGRVGRLGVVSAKAGVGGAGRGRDWAAVLASGCQSLENWVLWAPARANHSALLRGG